MPLLDGVLEQATQILLNHAKISKITWNIYNSIPASHLVSLITSFEHRHLGSVDKTKPPPPPTFIPN